MEGSFADWLFTQVDDEDHGELARAAKADPLFPKHGDRAIYEGYYEGSDPALRDQFTRSWNEFEGLPSQ